MIGNTHSQVAIGDIGVAAFRRDGYLVVPGLVPQAICAELTNAVTHDLDPLIGPAEFEADLGYPGAPPSREAEGGSTPRRLLHALARDDFGSWALHPSVAGILRDLMAEDDVRLSQCHHNCVMTKHPGYSSATHWHQDIRYWSFDRPELISMWIALGREVAGNGAIHVIPGSHELDLDRGRFDRDLFLRPELPENAALIESAQVVELSAGDAMFFHSRLFHAAGRNDSAAVKMSLVFTYHAADNCPIPGTRSAFYPSVQLPPSGPQS